MEGTLMTIFTNFNKPLTIIAKRAKKEYQNLKFNNNTYTRLQNAIIDQLPKDRAELKEIKLQTEQEIQRLELFNFDTFVSVRLGMYAYVLAIIAIIASRDDLFQKVGFNFMYQCISGLILFGLLIVFTLGTTSNSEKYELMYLKFKLQCINIIKK